MRVVVMDDYQGVAHRFADWGSIDDLDLVSIGEHITDERVLAERLAGAPVVVAMRERTPVTASLLDRLPDLRLVVTTGPRNAAIDVAAASARGIVVCGTGGFVTPTAELTWGLIHAVSRHIAADDATIRSGGWQSRIGSGLDGRRLGVIGLGNIGRLVTKVGLAFGMEVVAWSQHLTAERAAAAGARFVEKDELLSTSDVVTLHLVLSARTHHLIGAPELDAMPSTAILINTSRGPIVDQRALVEALHAGSIAGAGLDVFEVEPLPADDPLRSTPNTVLTPHTGYVTSSLYELFYREIVEDIAAWSAGSPIRIVAPPE